MYTSYPGLLYLINPFSTKLKETSYRFLTTFFGLSSMVSKKNYVYKEFLIYHYIQNTVFMISMQYASIYTESK